MIKVNASTLYFDLTFQNWRSNPVPFEIGGKILIEAKFYSTSLDKYKSVCRKSLTL